MFDTLDRGPPSPKRRKDLSEGPISGVCCWMAQGTLPSDHTYLLYLRWNDIFCLGCSTCSCRVKVSLVQNQRWWLNGHYYLLLVGTSQTMESSGNIGNLEKSPRFSIFLLTVFCIHTFQKTQVRARSKKGVQPTPCFFPSQKEWLWVTERRQVLGFFHSLLGWSWAWYY